MALISFFRLPNLLIIFMTLVGARRILTNDLGLSASESNLWLLTWCTILVTMAGNLINDYFDQKIDAVNKPEKLVVGKYFSGQLAIVFYALLNIAALAIVFFLAKNLGFATWTFWLYPAVIFGLWLYSYKLKCTPLVGNLAVALFCAWVPLQVWWLIGSEHPANTAELPERFGFYIVFAFLLTLWREIVKDLEDMKGDAAAQCNTLPFVLGETNTRFAALLLGGLCFAFLGYFTYSQVDTDRQIWYLPFLLVPCGVAINFLTKSGHPVFYQKASTVIKILMVIGVVMLAL